MAVGLTVEFTTTAARAAAFAAAWQQAAARVKAEDAGCRRYDLYASVDDASRFLLLEQWESQAALDAHIASAATAELVRPAIRDYLAPPIVHRYEVPD